LKAARQRLLRGNYEEAIAQFEALAKDPANKAAASLGISKAYQAKGQYDQALAVIETALQGQPGQNDLQARRAELFFLRGRWDEAEKTADAVLAADPKNLLSRWVRGQIFRDRGDFKKADAEFRWFTRFYNDNDVSAPEDLLLIGLATSEYSRWHKGLADQFQFIIDEIFSGILKSDKDFWPAEYHIGLLLLEKDNRPLALEAFDKALAINAAAAPVLVAKGRAALEQLEIKDAEKLAERALKINPQMPAALCLMAQIHLIGNDIPAALKELEKARQVNQRDELTLGHLAACLFLQRRQEELDALTREVSRFNPAPGLYFHTLAERLENRHRFESAEKYYQKAVTLHPKLAGLQNSLGLLYMRLGQEDQARKVLTEAFALDPFNVRVSNTLKVLRHLERYETLPTEHFALRFDPKNDKALAHFMAGYLEEIFANMAQQFNFRPRGPILIEVFATHEMFSGRIVALPDLHTIGASTGRMVALVSPHGKRYGMKMSPFNWGRVLRHELVHIFNQEQTQFQAPHWLTEGLAVINEGYPRPQQWNELLLERVPSGKVMSLDNIDLSFIRPHSPLDWHMAYCQSQLYVEYLKQKSGAPSIIAVLEAYRDGLDTAAVIQRVCKQDKAEFEKGYRAFLEEVTKGIKARPVEKPLTFSQLKEAHEKNPADTDVTARLAEQFFSRDKAQARKLAKEVLETKKGHALASYVLARLELLAGNTDEARNLLEAGLDRDTPEPKVLRELGKMYYNASQFDRAAELFELGHKVEPYDRQWLVELSRVYAQQGQRDKHLAVLEQLVPTDADDFENRKRLARLLVETSRYDRAERYARQALEIDFRDKEVQDLYEKALRAQNKNAEAERFREVVGRK
jgi:tetratricopeptide (TPR) repeat protein